MQEKIRKRQKTKRIRLIHRKEMWTLTAQGWVVTILSFVAFTIFTMTHIHPFLAVTSPVKADILVIEGWLPDYALKAAMAEFERGDYKKLMTTGLPVELGFYLSEYKNFAELSSATLIALGFDKEKLVAVPAPNVVKNRTDASAVAVRQWLSKSDLPVGALNLYSLDVHTRRSWLVYKQALAPLKVGAIAAQTEDYNPKKWWSSSAGVRTVIAETIAYIYALFVDWRN